jgi:hypothetical protein
VLQAPLEALREQRGAEVASLRRRARPSAHPPLRAKQILLATSQGAVRLEKQGFKVR